MFRVWTIAITGVLQRVRACRLLNRLHVNVIVFKIVSVCIAVSVSKTCGQPLKCSIFFFLLAGDWFVGLLLQGVSGVVSSGWRD